MKNDKILTLIKERLDLGYKRYGKTADELIDTGRDFEQEALEEVLDCMVYVSARLIELQDKRLINIIKEKSNG
tara:strand:- start:12648 stop:12866 length:219 start_codon:yes stop_codon:yes gene_type:complete